MKRTGLNWAIAPIATFSIISGFTLPVLAQEQSEPADPQQTAIQMLEENPEQVMEMMRSLLQTYPDLIQQLEQNPEQTQQLLDQSSELMEYLQHHPELVEQLQQVLQEQ
ncbi:MAG: hypothetical protein IGR76_12410 [Synechococcales cyanobacterium T60_A2020_003]|nr:hypothetical protein [Synechococcales cyanobacterium T60_A2020_003]